MASVAVIVAIAAAAYGGYEGSKAIGGKPKAVTQPAIPPPVATPQLDTERQKIKRPPRGRGTTILTGALEPKDVKKKRLLGAEAR